jgi:hypothetical protein
VCAALIPSDRPAAPPILAFNVSADSGMKPGLVLPGAVALGTGRVIGLALRWDWPRPGVPTGAGIAKRTGAPGARRELRCVPAARDDLPAIGGGANRWPNARPGCREEWRGQRRSGDPPWGRGWRTTQIGVGACRDGGCHRNGRRPAGCKPFGISAWPTGGSIYAEPI